MPTHLRLPIDYDSVAKRVARHEAGTLHSLLPFAAAVILAVVMWLAFVHYL